MRDDLVNIVTGETEASGKGRMLYIPLATLSDRVDMVKVARELFATVLDDRGYEMIGLLEWTGKKLAGRLVVTWPAVAT